MDRRMSVCMAALLIGFLSCEVTVALRLSTMSEDATNTTTTAPLTTITTLTVTTTPLTMTTTPLTMTTTPLTMTTTTTTPQTTTTAPPTMTTTPWPADGMFRSDLTTEVPRSLSYTCLERFKECRKECSFFSCTRCYSVVIGCAFEEVLGVEKEGSGEEMML